MAKNYVSKHYSDFDQIEDVEAFLDTLKNGFKDIADPRVQDNQSYPLTALLIIILCAIIAGANTITDIYLYSKTKLWMFQKLLGTQTAPSYNVFWWLLTRLKPDQIESCFVRWIQALPSEIKEKLISIDGKRLNGANRNQKIHLVSAWDSSRSLLLGQQKTQEKSNEITAIPQLLGSV